MDVSMLNAAGEALIVLSDPFRMLMLACGVMMGLMLGLLPGIGGLTGMAMLLPFTYTMEPYTAFALLLGMLTVTNTSDTIPAVMFGVPGTAASQATVLDGHAMAKKGQAGRALAAAFTASLIGGLFGALVLAVAIPAVRPFVLSIGSPELLAFSIFGISMVAVLSGSAPLRGLVVAGLGVLLSMVGTDPQTATPRWTFNWLYLNEGVPLIPFVLGIFALPELADMAIRRRTIANAPLVNIREGMWQGVKDVFTNIGLTIRCGSLGAAVGAIPGISGSVVDWLAYSHAAQSVKGAKETFGKGDVRGVIAPESANNSINAGTLVPTIAFGVPGSAGMAIILSIFLSHGMTPGRNMLTENLSFTYSLVWSIALANILAAGVCFAFSGPLARLSRLRFSLILPIIIPFIFIGAYQTTRSWGDLGALLLFAAIGWGMKRLGWPRPPLILGFVLGAMVERYLFISTVRYGWDWLTHPIVIILLSMSAIMIVRPLFTRIRMLGGFFGLVQTLGRPEFRATDLSYLAVVVLAVAMVMASFSWPERAAVGPQWVGFAMIALCTMSFLYQAFSRRIIDERLATGQLEREALLDTAVDDDGLSSALVAVRAAKFLGLLIFVLSLIATVGVILAIPVFIIAFMRIEGRERWIVTLTYAVAMTTLVYAVFDQILTIPWPNTVLGTLVPQLQVIPGV